MPEEVPFPPAGFSAVLLFDDPTPNAALINRITRPMFEIAATTTDLTPQELNDFFDLVILIARKMVSIWRHLQEYHAEERRVVAKVEAIPDHREYSQLLFEEFDVFAVQIRSALDHVAQVMRPMLGRQWTPYAFANKGKGVLSSLRTNTSPKHHAGRVRMLEYFVFNDTHNDWLEAILDSRDRMNHCQAGGLKIDKFIVCRNPDGSVRVPMWTPEQTLGGAMDSIWSHFFTFVEDYLAIALHFRLRIDEFGMFRTPVPVESPDSAWTVTTRAEADAMLAKLGRERPV